MTEWNWMRADLCNAGSHGRSGLPWIGYFSFRDRFVHVTAEQYGNLAQRNASRSQTDVLDRYEQVGHGEQRQLLLRGLSRHKPLSEIDGFVV